MGGRLGEEEGCGRPLRREWLGGWANSAGRWVNLIKLKLQKHLMKPGGLLVGSPSSVSSSQSMEAKEAFRIGAYEGLIDVLLCLKKQGDAVSIPSIKGLKPSNGFTTVSFKRICMPISNNLPLGLHNMTIKSFV